MTSAVQDPATAPLEELFLLLFTTLDDLYPSIAPPELTGRPGAHRLAMSDSEILTLSLMQEALSMDSELAFHRFVSRNYAHLFPRLLSRDRYHRRRKNLLYLHQACFDHFARLAEEQATYLVVDSAPVETVAFARSQSGQASLPEASYGFIPSKKRHFFGLRLHALVTDRGSVAAFALTSADSDERSVARDLLAERAGCQVLADSGYPPPSVVAASRCRRGASRSTST